MLPGYGLPQLHCFARLGSVLRMSALQPNPRASACAEVNRGMWPSPRCRAQAGGARAPGQARSLASGFYRRVDLKYQAHSPIFCICTHADTLTYLHV